MTAMCTGLALVSLILFGNLPGHEIEYPIAVVIVGGLVSSTFLTLFFLPMACESCKRWFIVREFVGSPQ
jgi:Cu/Ag efflux pump CusA